MTLDERAAAMTHEEVVALTGERFVRGEHWFKRQLFG